MFHVAIIYIKLLYYIKCNILLQKSNGQPLPSHEKAYVKQDAYD